MDTTAPLPHARGGIKAVQASPYRWMILFLCWLAFTSIYINRTAWSVVAVDASHTLGLSIADLGIFATAMSIGYVVSNIPGGIVADWLGGRLAIGISLVGAGILTFAFGAVHNVAVGVVVQILIGLISGADVASFSKLLSRWFPLKERATAFGIYITSTALGGVVANATIPSLLARYTWHGVYFIVGVFVVIVAILCWALLRNRPKHEVDGNAAAASKPLRDRLGLRGILTNWNLMFLTVAGFGMQWGTLGFLAWGNSLMIKSFGVSTGQAALVMVIVSSTAIGAKPLVGFLSDRIKGGRKTHLIVLSGYFMVILVVFGFAGSYGALLALAPLLGIGLYGYTPLTNETVTEFADARFIGSAIGVANTAWQIGGVFAPIAVGAAFSSSGSLPIALAVLALGPLVGVIFMLPVRRHNRDETLQAAELRSAATAQP